jgi:cytochrome P450
MGVESAQPSRVVTAYLDDAQAELALPAILQRLPELRLVEDIELEAVPGYFLRGMVKLPLQFRAS